MDWLTNMNHMKLKGSGLQWKAVLDRTETRHVSSCVQDSVIQGKYLYLNFQCTSLPYWGYVCPIAWFLHILRYCTDGFDALVKRVWCMLLSWQCTSNTIIFFFSHMVFAAWIFVSRSHQYQEPNGNSHETKISLSYYALVSFWLKKSVANDIASFPEWVGADELIPHTFSYFHKHLLKFWPGDLQFEKRVLSGVLKTSFLRNSFIHSFILPF